jgi:hypothetical protein
MELVQVYISKNRVRVSFEARVLGLQAKLAKFR